MVVMYQPVPFCIYVFHLVLVIVFQSLALLLSTQFISQMRSRII